MGDMLHIANMPPSLRQPQDDAVTFAENGISCHIADSLKPPLDCRLDDFLNRGCDYSFMQHWSWPRLIGSTRIQQFRHLWCERADDILLSGVTRLTTLFPGRYLAFLPRGPVTRRISDLATCLPSVMSTLRNSGVCTLLINPRWEDAEAETVQAILSGHGFQAVERHNQTMYSATGVIPLDRSEREIFAGFKSRCRRDIRAATRAGLVIRRVTTEADAAQFAEMYHDFVRSKRLDVAGIPVVTRQYRHIHRHGGAMLIAEFEGKLVGGITALREGHRATVNILASLPLARNVSRSNSLVWQAAREAKRQGCRTLDLAGLPEMDDPDDGSRGRRLFKMAFNPTPVNLVPMHFAVLRPASHSVLFRARQAYRRSPLCRYVSPLLRSS